MVNELHAEVDARAAAIAEKHAGLLECRRGCFGCCVDGITVFEVEAERIRAGAADLLATARSIAPRRNAASRLTRSRLSRRHAICDREL